MAVLPEWIDYNGHMNMAYYSVLFDRGVDQVYEQLGVGPDYASRSGCTTFSAEFHICYLRELRLGDEVRVSFRMMDVTEKSFHIYQEIHHLEGWRAATGEGVALHIDRSGPRVTPMPPEVLARLQAMHAAHSVLPIPDKAGRKISLRAQ